MLSFEKPENIWADNPHSICLATTITLYRNIANFNFTSKLEGSKRIQLGEMLSSQLKSVPNQQPSNILMGENLSSLDKEFIFEHFMLLDPITHLQQGDGVALYPQGDFLALMNAKEHLALHTVLIKQDMEEGLKKMIQIENALGMNLPFAFSKQFGFLSADPVRSGSGLQVCAFLHLPALLSQGLLKETLDKLADQNLSYTGLQGNPEDLLGHIIVLYNTFSLGSSEDTYISMMHSAINKIQIAENSVRQHLMQNKNSEFFDRISRAFGLLRYSYQLATVEALEALSWIKLGIDLKLVEGIDQRKINYLLCHIRRAHLSESRQDLDRIPQYRASLLHETLKDMVLCVS